MEGHIFPKKKSEFESYVWYPTYQLDPRECFKKGARRINSTPLSSADLNRHDKATLLYVLLLIATRFT